MTYNLDYQFHKKQLEFLKKIEKTDKNNHIFLGGWGSGKSAVGSRWIISKALEKPESEWLILAPSHSSGKQGTYSNLFEALPGEKISLKASEDRYGLENSPIVQSFNKGDWEWSFKNGSLIVFGNSQNSGKYGSTEYDGIWADETVHYKVEKESFKDFLDMLKSRLRKKDGENQLVMTSSTEKLNHWYDFVEKSEQHGYDFTLTKAEIDDNDFLDEEVIREQKKTLPDRKISADFIVPEDLVFNIENINYTFTLPSCDYEKIYSTDYGYVDYDVVLDIYYNLENEAYYVLDEYYENETDTEELYNFLRKKEKGTVYTEHNPEKKSKLKEKTNHKVKNADKNIDVGIESVQEEIKKENLYIDEKCQNLIEELQDYKYNDIGSSSAKDHAIDALRYAIHSHKQNQKKGWDEIEYTFGIDK